MMDRALEQLDPGVLITPEDGLLLTLGEFDADHTKAMAVAEASGLLRGIVDYGLTWSPWAAALRGEVAQMLYNLTQLI